MQSNANTLNEYFDKLYEEHKNAMQKLRQTILFNLPDGFEEVIQYGMPSYVVPHSIYPDGYHCNPKQPFPFLGMASQKNFIAVYYMGIYADPNLMNWFTEEYPKHCKLKLDIGKSCIRLKKWIRFHTN